MFIRESIFYRRFTNLTHSLCRSRRRGSNPDEVPLLRSGPYAGEVSEVEDDGFGIGSINSNEKADNDSDFDYESANFSDSLATEERELDEAMDLGLGIGGGLGGLDNNNVAPLSFFAQSFTPGLKVGKKRYLRHKSLFIFGRENKFRRGVDAVVSSTWFRLFMMLLIVANCIAFGFIDPVHRDSDRNRAIDIVNYSIGAFFTLEAILKIIAFGLLLHEKAYLRDGWNILDLVIVATSTLDLFLPRQITEKIDVLRVLRVLRVLKAIDFIPSLKRLATTLVRSLPYIFHVGILLAIFYLVFGLVGVELFGGYLHQRCVDPEDPTFIDEMSCVMPSQPDWLGGRKCDAALNLTCQATLDNPNQNTTSFDDFGVACLSIFQSITLEGWAFIGYHVMNSVSDWAVIYFVLLVIWGTFFFMNLFLAAIQGVYVVVHEEEKQHESLLAQVMKKRPRRLVGCWEHFVRWLKRPEEPDPRAKFWFYRMGAWIKTKVLEWKYLEYLIDGLVFLSLMLLALHFYPEPSVWDQILGFTDFAIAIIFSIELLVRFLGLGIYGFCANVSNLFDAFVVAGSWVDIAFDASGAFLAFRGLRLLRLFRVLERWKRLKHLASIAMAALPMLGNTLVLMGVLLYMFTIMGMELFGGKMDFPEGKPRFHYDTLWQAFVSVFNVLGIENWHAALYPAVRALGTRAAALFYVGIIIILNYILLNLFISILLDQFGEAAQSDREEQQKKDESAVHQQFVKQLSETVEEPTAQSFARQLSDDAMDRLLDAHADGDNNDSIALLHPSTAKTRNKTNHAPLHGKSLLLFPPHSKLRQTLAAITSHAIFDAFITIIILGSCAALIAETSHVLSTNNQMKAAYLTVDIILMVIFGLEFIFKIIAYGLVGHKGSYLRNGWNVIDFLTVIALAVVLISSGAGANLRFLRSFMALRPLRLLSRFRSTRIIVKTLIRSVPAIASVIPIAMFIWLVFSILGVQLYAGKLGNCSDPHMPNKTMCEGNFTIDGVVFDREWQTPDNNFDNILQSWFSIFKMSTGEGWPETLGNLMDVTGVEIQPERDAAPLNALFIMAFVPLCIWFVLGLVVGTIVDAFDEIRSSESEANGDSTDPTEQGSLESSNEVILTKDQRRWIQLQQVMISIVPRVTAPPPTNKIRLFLYDVVASKKFEYAVTLVIIANAIVLSLSKNNYNGSGWDPLQSTADYIFGALYMVELVIRLVALGPIHYIQDRWNILDVVSILTTIASWPLQDSDIGRLLRLVKILRIIKITKLFRGLRVLWKTTVMSLAGMASVSVVLLVVLFVFAVIGVFLFADVPDGGEISYNANFRSFGRALFLVMRMGTGENWDTVMHDVARATSDWSIIYFVVFTFCVTYILMQLYVAVLLDNFDFVTTIEEGSISVDTIVQFKSMFRAFDKDDVGSIPATELIRFLRNLRPPLGLGFGASKITALAYLKELNIPVYYGRVKFTDLLMELSQNAIGLKSIPAHVKQRAIEAINRRWYRTMSDHAAADAEGLSSDQSEVTARGVAAVVIIQRAIRRWREKAGKSKLSPKTRLFQDVGHTGVIL